MEAGAGVYRLEVAWPFVPPVRFQIAPRVPATYLLRFGKTALEVARYPPPPLPLRWL